MGFPNLHALPPSNTSPPHYTRAWSSRTRLSRDPPASHPPDSLTVFPTAKVPGVNNGQSFNLRDRSMKRQLSNTSQWTAWRRLFAHANIAYTIFTNLISIGCYIYCCYIYMYNLTTLCLNGTLPCVDFMDVIMGDLPSTAETLCMLRPFNVAETLCKADVHGTNVLLKLIIN